MPELGTRALVELKVTADHLAGAMPIYADLPARLPGVFATVYMVALMEKAAASILAQFVEGDETSVGIAVDVTHDAATAEGQTVTAEAILKVAEGRKFIFEVIARDSSGIIGKGSHKRAIVKRSLIEATAKEKVSPSVA